MKKQAVFREQALTNNPSSSYHSSPQQVRFQEPAFVMGNGAGVNAYHLNRTALKQRFAEDVTMLMKQLIFWCILRWERLPCNVFSNFLLGSSLKLWENGA